MLKFRSIQPYLLNYRRKATKVTGADYGGLADLGTPGEVSKFIKNPVHVKKNDVHFVTCPIFYATSSPHIGHIHTAIIGDFFHR